MTAPAVDGVLVVDKPEGPTSHDVVARVRRALGTRAVGHTGTLDPLATGVLALVVGRATRLAQFLSGSDKEYVADVRFGAATDTYDALGEPLPPADGQPPVPADLAAALAPALARFVGAQRQTPPPFSAKKIAGTPAYRLARQQRPVELEPVPVAVETLELVAAAGDRARLRVVCSSGYYVRTLAHDLGAALGCGAHLAALRRTRAGEFTVDAAVPLARVEQEGRAAAARVVPLDRLLPGFPQVVVNERGARRAAHGNALGPADLAAAPPAAAGGRLRIVAADGTLIGIARPGAGGILHPTVVLV